MSGALGMRVSPTRTLRAALVLPDRGVRKWSGGSSRGSTSSTCVSLRGEPRAGLSVKKENKGIEGLCIRADPARQQYPWALRGTPARAAARREQGRAAFRCSADGRRWQHTGTIKLAPSVLFEDYASLTAGSVCDGDLAGLVATWVEGCGRDLLAFMTCSRMRRMFQFPAICGTTGSS